MRPQATFSFFIFFYNYFIFSLSSSLLPPPPYFLLVPLSSLSLLPPRPSFLLIPLFFLIQHCPNHLESVKVDFSSILTKALPTNGRTNGPTDQRGQLGQRGPGVVGSSMVIRIYRRDIDTQGTERSDICTQRTKG